MKNNESENHEKIMKNNANNEKLEKKMKKNEVNLLSKRIMTNNDTLIC